jgi:D-glycero-alpha-D-manno-heptose 1-phosphate guanylyltransferase
MQAIILAGGLGTRLRTAVSDIPKSLAEVAGRPFLEYLLHQLARDGLSDVVICTGFMADAITERIGTGQRWNMRIEYSTENEPLGTAGALKLAAPRLAGDRWLLMNGDSLFDISLKSLMDEHERNTGVVTIALARVADARRYGRVTCDADGAITHFAEKTDALTPGLINSGLYIIERPLFDLIPDKRPVSLERDVLPLLVGTGLRGQPYDGYFIDIGVPDDYARAARDQAVFERLASRS